MTHLTLITGNSSKVKEFSELMGLPLANKKLSLVEVQAIDVAEVAAAKAAQAFEILKSPIIVDDTGFSINAWNQLPGALISWFLDSVGNAGILQMAEYLKDRQVEVKTALGYADENGVQVFEGGLLGELAFEERGDNGFGYDTIFIPAGQELTFAEMTSAEKNEISMRRRAVDAFQTGMDPVKLASFGS